MPVRRLKRINTMKRNNFEYYINVLDPIRKSCRGFSTQKQTLCKHIQAFYKKFINKTQNPLLNEQKYIKMFANHLIQIRKNKQISTLLNGFPFNSTIL